MKKRREGGERRGDRGKEENGEKKRRVEKVASELRACILRECDIDIVRVCVII